MGAFAPEGIFGNVWRCFLLSWPVEVETVYGCLVSRGQKSCSTGYSIEDSAHNKELNEQNVSSAEIDTGCSRSIHCYLGEDPQGSWRFSKRSEILADTLKIMRRS